MGILAGLYALLGIGGTAYLTGSGIGSIFRKEASNEEFCDMFRKEQQRREESRMRYKEIHRGKPAI
jgi:hypothetical protein